MNDCMYAEWKRGFDGMGVVTEHRSTRILFAWNGRCNSQQYHILLECKDYVSVPDSDSDSAAVPAAAAVAVDGAGAGAGSTHSTSPSIRGKTIHAYTI